MVVAVEFGLLEGDAFVDDFLYGFSGGELGFLFEVSDACVFSDDAVADVFVVDSGHDAHEAGFAGAVAADNADAGSEEEGEVDLFENGFGAVLFG